MIFGKKKNKKKIKKNSKKFKKKKKKPSRAGANAELTPYFALMLRSPPRRLFRENKKLATL
jgi:hypothetical protein